MTIYSPVQNSNIKLKQDLPDPLCYLYADEYFYGLAGNVAEEAFKAGDWVNKINNNGINSFNNFCTNKKSRQTVYPSTEILHLIVRTPQASVA
jgi:hypothetical protein